MYPIIFSYKFLTIGGYGVVLGIAFYLSFLLAEREYELHGKDPELAYKLLLAVIPSAIVGAKIFHILESMNEFLRDPMGMIFSGAGLSVYGGFIMAFIVCYFVIKRNNENVLEVFDITTPSMALGYAIGRIGCHVAGDGCYGIETSSFLGTPYPNGIVPTSLTVYPTPLFESLFAFFVFLFLMQMRKRELPTGTMFFTYLLLYGVPRFFVEFIRLNPKIAFNLSQAQIVSIFYVLTGIIGLILVRKVSKQNPA